MRLLVATVFAFFLTACQTLGVEGDPQALTKQTIAATSIAVDAVGAYGTQPPCLVAPQPCQKPKAYADAKLLAKSFAASLQLLKAQERPSVFLTAGLLYWQFQLAKTIADAPGPTNPEAPPSDSVAKQLAALQMADVLIMTSDQRVRDAASPNVTVAELLAELDRKVAALP